MSFFDDGEDTAPQQAAQSARPRSASGEAPPQRPRPRRPQRSSRAGPVDQHTLTVRRLVAAGVGVLLLIVIVLFVNSCVKSERTQALKDYNRNVSLIATESDEQVSAPLFSALTGASSK